MSDGRSAIYRFAHYAYAWADGVYLQARMEDHGECMLVLIGATPEGKKELIGFQIGVRESAQSWRELLVGLNVAPEIAVGDGALGSWKAIEEIFPGTRHQRCWGRREEWPYYRRCSKPINCCMAADTGNAPRAGRQGRTH